MNQFLVENAGTIATATMIIISVLGYVLRSKVKDLKQQVMDAVAALHTVIHAIEEADEREGTAKDAKKAVEKKQDVLAQTAPGVAQIIADGVAYVDPKTKNRSKATEKGLALLRTAVRIAKAVAIPMLVLVLIVGCAHSVETRLDGTVVETWAVDVNGVNAAVDAAPAVVEVLREFRDEKPKDPSLSELLINSLTRIAIADIEYSRSVYVEPIEPVKLTLPGME